jgi:sugar lactone lactonase YvrE
VRPNPPLFVSSSWRRLAFPVVLMTAACTSTAPPGPATSLAAAGLPNSVLAGAAVTVTVTAEDASGHAATGYTGTVHFTSTDPAAVLPPNYTFVGADAGSHTFSVTLKTAGSQAVTATDAASSITGSQAVTVTPGAAATLVVSVFPCSALVTAKDAFGNAATGYTGTVHFTSTDPAAVLPPNYTFVGADAGSHTFPIILMTAGRQAVTATDAATNSITGSQVITVPALSDKALYVANGSNTITVYAAGANCNATPTASIAGTNTGLADPEGIALDAGGQLHVANYANNSITAYASGGTGNVTPTATIAGGNTRLNLPIGIAFDAAGRLYVANSSSRAGNSITIYAAGATGNVAPVDSIVGNNTGLNDGVGIAFDAAGRLYVASMSGYGTITVYAAGASGDATPVATIAGSNTGLDGRAALAVDAAGQLYVANENGDSIMVFAAGATGNVSPTATIAGSHTGLNAPIGLSFDAAGQLYVANAGKHLGPGGNTITIYAAGATGNATPIATLAGSSTGLSAPTFITF